MAGHGTRAVIAALLANTGIAITKFIAWLLTGASSMLAEIVMEALSFRTAIKESNTIRGGHSWVQFVRRAKAPELPVILLEDLGALLGLTFALIGVGMALLTDNAYWDAAGTAAIGVLLVVIAI